MAGGGKIGIPNNDIWGFCFGIESKNRRNSIMRLSKRIAAVALAAVMAVSMLTACGGGGGNIINAVTQGIGYI